ncbi:MAG: ABC transporter ATP-binding protein [bacterium]
MIPALETEALGKRYGSKWALQDCSFSLQPGSIAALLGPNGAGKSTLLELAVGLRRPSAGSIRVFGHEPLHDSKQVLPLIGFVGQERPLYRGFSIADMITFGRKLNEHWDDEFAHERIAWLDLDPRKKVGDLSGGQQAQVALVLAFAKRAQLLLLDEPIAAFDPLARREFLQLLTETVADREVTVLLSSHILGDLERVCDSLILLTAASTRLSGSIDEVLATHRLLVGPREEQDLATTAHAVISRSESERQVSLLVRKECPIVLGDRWTVTEPSLEEIVIAYMERPKRPRPVMEKEAVLA